jgi:hypothetical protein
MDSGSDKRAMYVLYDPNTSEGVITATLCDRMYMAFVDSYNEKGAAQIGYMRGARAG